MAKPAVIVVGADKGGVGKTFVSRAVLSYLEDRGVRTRAFDTENETPNGVLRRFHPDAELVDLTHSDGQVAVFDALPLAPVTLIDIRAGLLSRCIKDLAELGFLEMAREGKIDITVLHVLGSSVASLNEVASASSALASARHFLVTNHINDASFFAGISNVPTHVFETHKIIDVPKLDERAAEFVEASSLPFLAFSKDESQSLVMRRKVGHWLSLVCTQLDTAKLVA
ncbi:MAG: hypothetical protein WA418_37915 [Bradyrhizobium sp.]